MVRPPLLLTLAVLACSLLRAEPKDAGTLSESPSGLDFEPTPGDALPAGWSGGPPGTVFLDGATIYSGKSAVRLERAPGSPKEFSTLTKSLPIGFRGSEVEFGGFVKTENVSGFAGLWLREDGAEGQLEFDNMQRRRLNGTTEWKEYFIVLPLNPAARTLHFGFLLAGTGKAWVDGLQLLVDGKPYGEALKAEPILPARDHEFDEGSRIDLAGVTPVQVGNLATLAKVWGFLKYYHPKVRSGNLQWDFELFRVMPAVIGAIDQTAANAVLERWVESLGELGADHSAMPTGTDIYLLPDLSWTTDETLLGKKLSGRLRAVAAARPPNDVQCYVSLAPSLRKPVFANELGYPQIKLPDAGFQLLGLFRYWNIIRYWSPYRDLIDQDWDSVLFEFIPRVARAKNATDYWLEMMALISTVRDTHANLWGSLGVRPPVGDSQLPVIVRFISGHPVVAGILEPPGGKPSGLQRGDAIETIDGQSVEELVAAWSPYYAASNEPTRQRDMARSMGRGPAKPARIGVRRDGAAIEVEAARWPGAAMTRTGDYQHDLPGPTFRLLSPSVAYLKLSSVKADDCGSYVEQARGTRGWIIDARNYPSEFVVFDLGSHLVKEPTEFARITVGNLMNPGEFSFAKAIALSPRPPHYEGKIVVLVDEITQSQGEYTAMAFRSAPGAVVIGSTTAGADGDVAAIPLPGGLKTMMSGVGIFYPDRRPTQRVGIVPDIRVNPTLEGIRAGRDEVLERALKVILGPDTATEEIQRLGTLHE